MPPDSDSARSSGATLTERARATWLEVALTTGAHFHADGQPVVLPHHRTAPLGWVGIVVIDEQALVAAPDDRAADWIRSRWPAGTDWLRDPASLAHALGPSDLLGPAALFYSAGLPSAPGNEEVVAVGRAEALALSDGVSPDEADESGLDEVTSGHWAVRRDGIVVAAAGYRTWPAETAHVSVLTSPSYRGSGFGKAVSRAAINNATANGMLAQWRARVAASIGIARSIGMHELGWQLSLRPPWDESTRR